MTYPNSAQGLGSRSQMQVAAQSDYRHVPSSTTFRDYRTNLGDIAAEVSAIQQEKILAGGAPSTPLEGKGVFGIITENIGDADPNCYGFMHHLANLFGNYTLTNNSTWYHHRYSLAGATTASTYLTKLLDDDHHPRRRLTGCRVGAFELTASPNENLSCAFEYGVGAFDLYGPVSQEAGSGSDLPTFGGVYGQWNTEGSSIADIDVQLSNVSGSVLTLKTKLSTDGSYTGTSQSYTLGNNPVRLLHSDGTGVLGTRANTPTFFMPSGATVSTSDEFQVQSRRDRWTASYPAQQSISSVQSVFVLDGEEIKVEGGYTLRIFWDEPGLEFKPDIYGRQGGTVTKAGVLRAQVELSREIVDLDIQKALWSQSTVSLVVDAQTDSTITTNQPYKFQIFMPEVRPAGTMFTPGAGGQNTGETLTLEAGIPAASLAYDGETITTSEHVCVILENGISAY